jgi:hypothetical protein
VNLCAEHHRGTKGVHGKEGKVLADFFKRLGQVWFEDYHGTREEFIRIFGRSYL